MTKSVEQRVGREKPNVVRCPRCRREFATEWADGDFETCPVYKMEFLIRPADLVRCVEAAMVEEARGRVEADVVREAKP